jgi:hypothetical protein
MADYSVRIFQFSFYFKKYMPDLYYHFKNQNIPNELLFSKWILTIFSFYLPFDVLSHVWTLFILVIFYK